MAQHPEALQPDVYQLPPRSRPRPAPPRAPTGEGSASGEEPAGPRSLAVRAGELAVRPEVVGPHARLGLVWTSVTFAACVAGQLWLAAWLAPVAGLAAAQAAFSWSKRRKFRRRPATLLAGLGALVLVLASAAGPLGSGVAGGAFLALVLVRALSPGRRRFDARLTTVIAATSGLAGAAPVLLRGQGLVAPMVLLALAAAYDASAYLVGSGAATAWEGPAAGIASIGTVTLAVAAVFVPPFRGASPWLLGALAAVLAPLGPLLGTALLGDPEARVPALRRLDSLFLLGPLWSLAAFALVA